MDDPLATFARVDATEAELRIAAVHLGVVTERPAFWSAIANDAGRPVVHRAFALVQLLQRHVLPGTTSVGALAGMLAGAVWLGEGAVTIVTALGGKVPVAWSPDDTTAAISLPGGRGALYLAIVGRFSAAEVAVALRGASRDAGIRSAVIRDAGWVF